MDINKIDKNFLQNENIDTENTKFYSVDETPFELYGVFYDENKQDYMRMPYETAKTVSFGVEDMNYCSAGGRLRFSTDSSFITAIVRYNNIIKMPHMALIGSSGFAVCENVYKNGSYYEKFVCSFGPFFKDTEKIVRSKNLNGKNDGVMHDYTLYFPLYSQVKEIVIGLHKSATVRRGLKYKNVLPIVYYGSSITQGGCASRPDTCYQAMIAKKNNIDYINLGFSGHAKGEDCMIDYLKKLACSVFVLDYDHNASVDILRETHYKMYCEIRKNNPETPIVLISRPDYYSDNSSAKRLRIIKNTYHLAKNNGDENVYFINGKNFFGSDYFLCTVDGVHPTDLGFYKMYKKIIKVLNKVL